MYQIKFVYCSCQYQKINHGNHNCDIIKGNESDVGNVDFELQA